MKRTETTTERFVVFGAARSGLAAARLLKRQGADVMLMDGKDAAPPDVANELAAAGIENRWGAAAGTNALAGRTVMVKSPGIPQDNLIVTAARAAGMRVIGELELAAAFVDPAAKVIAVTGTNGKTTTTAWIAHILNRAGFDAVAVGNIGTAWSDAVDAPERAAAAAAARTTVFVAECSSFQLEDVEDFRPDVAMLTNFSPDHMDRYTALNDYKAAKANVARNMGTGDTLIVNAGDPGSAGFASGAFETVAFAGAEGPDFAEVAANVRGGRIVLSGGDGTPAVDLIAAVDLPLPGAHNVENALAAALAAGLVKAPVEAIVDGLRTFAGVEHRIEFVRELGNGVRFYNDSKATNVDSTEKALLAFAGRPVVLIAGGRDKHTGYAPLVPLAGGLRALVTLGEAAPLIEAELAGHVAAVERVPDMAAAVARAASLARPGDVVLLSPACASYDMYRDFEERGRDFKRCVAELLAG